MKRSPRIVWVGFHEEGRFALPALIDAGHDVCAVVTLDDEAAAKRSGVFEFASVAAQYDIPCHKIKHINDDSSIELLRDFAPDVLCVIGWSQILSPEALATAGIVIGAHASLLPEGKGSAPINWALIKGMTRTGNTLIRLSEGVDEGDILAQREFEITDEDTCATLYDKVAETNAEMLLEVLGHIQRGTLEPVPQPPSDAPLWPRRRPEDGLIDWAQDGRQVYDFVRALTRPYPGAFAFANGQKVTVWKASRVDIKGKPGSVQVTGAGVRVACGNGGILLRDVSVDGVGDLQRAELVRHFKDIRNFDEHE